MQALIADYSGLNDKMLKMGELIHKMAAAIDDLEENVERLDISWSGEANTQFMIAFYDDFNKMRNLIESMSNFKKTLRQIIFEYQKTELMVSERAKETRI